MTIARDLPLLGRQKDHSTHSKQCCESERFIPNPDKDPSLNIIPDPELILP
jgi:hypothetical protein